MMDEHRIETVDVEAADAPARARVDLQPAPPGLQPAVQRKVDYLEGFLSRKPEPLAETEIGGELYEAVVAALKDIYDPEIPVNIYDLGLIYGVEIGDGGHARVSMTLTTPNCPVAESMPMEVELRVGAVPGIGDAEVVLVWDPPWDPSKMTDEAKLELGML